jgi:hypothetical protein
VSGSREGGIERDAGQDHGRRARRGEKGDGHHHGLPRDPIGERGLPVGVKERGGAPREREGVQTSGRERDCGTGVGSQGRHRWEEGRRRRCGSGGREGGTGVGIRLGTGESRGGGVCRGTK